MTTTEYLRKNAKVLKEAFKTAVEFVFVDSFSNVDDSVAHKNAVTVSKEEALELYTNWYSNVGVTAKFKNGVLVSIKIREYNAWWGSSLTVVLVKDVVEAPKVEVAHSVDKAQAK
ncbi:hypothetical protein ACTTZI_004157 [Vibrio vulnificus]